ncbi:N-acetyl sugar amidotransferase [Legionella hackeliae]|uniref:Legionaminic acid biosynthesis protein PtmG n=1 Tax=Legionella hackeliae TaxID=449 RepID=A0A0A8URU3_LEGHA|nr:N-acetyl sugar amidotransferase [Legionella hackeliae]KTD08798.1 LPS biosynthesis protein, PseA-like protein [Legionella hackeliae]CEK10226.1 conserved protein of unknown function [Legionella hackeliae]STX46955.1 LPS biosynthesis protein, PseA-like protein [Legionella hackeliae]
MDRTVFWCSTCLNMSTRPRIEFDAEGRCNACVWAEEKKTLDWKSRQLELISLLEMHRSKTGGFDCIVPVSGGKDGSYVSYKLKYEYDMHPLAVTVAPPLTYDIGDKNLKNYINSGFDHIHINPNYKVMKALNKKGFLEQGRPLYGWTTAIFTSVIRIANNFGIPLIFYGEDGEVEYGGSTESKNRSIFDIQYIKKIYLEGNYENTLKQLFSESELYFWLFPQESEWSQKEIFMTHMSYFEPWDPYRNYLVAKEHCGLMEKTDSNSGTYTNFAQNDNSLYDLHTYLMYLKFGFGRCTQDVGIDIRRGAMTREQGIQLAKIYDNAKPEIYVDDYLDYYEISREEFEATIDRFANKQLFEKSDGLWLPKFEIQ